MREEFSLFKYTGALLLALAFTSSGIFILKNGEDAGISFILIGVIFWICYGIWLGQWSLN